MNQQRMPNRSTSKKPATSMSPNCDSGVNISTGISKAISKLQEVNVEKKKEGLDDLSVMLNKHHQKLGKATNYNDLITVLKNRIIDSQRIVLKPLLNTVAKLIK